MKISKLLYSLLVIAVVFSSCKKSFLDQSPSTAVDVTSSIHTANDLTDAVNGLYAAAKVYTLFGRDIPVLGDLLPDNDYISSSNYGRYLVENNYTFISNSGEANDIWLQGYYTILQANRIISSGLAPDSVVNQLVGEAYTIRALTYLELVNFFATPYAISSSAPGVPIVTVPTEVTGPELKPARNSVADVYTRIITDLDSAYELMSVTPIPSAYHATNSAYVAKYTAKAIESRAYLYEGDYADALDAALLVVQNGGYTLTTSASAFTTYWTNPDPVTSKQETILEFDMSVTSNNGSNGLDYMYNQSGYGDLLATDSLYYLYSSTDNRRSLILNGIRKGNSEPAFICNKYTNVTNADRDELKIIRYAEVLLTLAESYANTGDEPDALKYLNLLAQNRDPGFAGYTSSGAQLITDILNERRKELAFEGLRFFDLTRLNLVINRPHEQFSYPSYPLVTTSDFRRLQPIPLVETEANPNIVQNPNY
jgi:hypothetical protein